MNAIKTSIASLLFSLAVLFPALVNAQGQKFTSKVLGVTVEVPTKAENLYDDTNDGMAFATAEKDFVFVAIPFKSDMLTKEQIAGEYAKWIESTKIDLNKAIHFNGKNETLDFEGDIQDFPSGGCCVVCKAYAKGSKHCFFVVLTATSDFVQSIHTVFRTINFDKSVIK